MSLPRLNGNRALGNLQITGPEGNVVLDTFTCAHCNRQRIWKPEPNCVTPEEYGGKVCMACHSMICLDCAKLETCEPFEKKLEAMEASARFRKAIGD
jgi:hypothetical protein